MQGLLTCEICKWDMAEIFVCSECGTRFCEDCGDMARELCYDCLGWETEDVLNEE